MLVNENKCKGWRMCVAACPYKKVYYNWATGKSEKCILCFPRLETGQAPACFHTCVGRIRYLGVILYDADRIATAAKAETQDLVQAQLDAILDPFDPAVMAAAQANGLGEDWIKAAQASPVYKFVKVWKLALPLHPEYRTLAMLFYIPPLSPIVSTLEEGLIKLELPPEQIDFELFNHLQKARLPLEYLANLFAAGNVEVVKPILRKLLAVRIYKRRQSVEGTMDQATLRLEEAAGTTPEEIEAIYQLTAKPTLQERFVVPPYHREMAVEVWNDPLAHKGETGVGFLELPVRGD